MQNGIIWEYNVVKSFSRHDLIVPSLTLPIFFNLKGGLLANKILLPIQNSREQSNDQLYVLLCDCFGERSRNYAYFKWFRSNLSLLYTGRHSQ